jgi:hypothetical protein
MHLITKGRNGLEGATYKAKTGRKGEESVDAALGSVNDLPINLRYAIKAACRVSAGEPPESLSRSRLTASSVSVAAREAHRSRYSRRCCPCCGCSACLILAACCRGGCRRSD